MSVFLQPIYTQTVGATAVASVTFNSIPQGFTDLKLVFSGRTNASSVDRDIPYILINGTSVGTTNTRLYGIPNVATGSDRSSGLNLGYVSTATNTSNTFGSQEVYVPNYSGANYKSFVIDGVSESNSTTQVGLTLVAGLWSNTAAITSLSIYGGSGSWVQYSTFTLYGVLRQGI